MYFAVGHFASFLETIDSFLAITLHPGVETTKWCFTLNCTPLNVRDNCPPYNNYYVQKPFSI